MSRLTWYWHRLRAMSAAEMALHARKKLRQRRDAARLPDWPPVEPANAEAYPRLPDPAQAPEALRQGLVRDATDILAGRWTAFGHLKLQVDDPPRWYRDYLAGRDFITAESAFDLDHRALPDGGDIKLIWELSRWHPLTRLAMAAFVLGDARAAAKCLDWLEDWVKHNPPYRGWNWTSALEAGMRLIQFAWIDALVAGASVVVAESVLKKNSGSPSPRPSPPGEGETPPAPVDARRLDSLSAECGELPLPGGEGRGEGGLDSQFLERLAWLRHEILPAHVRFTWRYQSFGSSANNHLLGELAGLICAVARWPALARWAAPIEELQRRWEREVLAQFAGDGGNREQALNYQLFSWELCWHTRAALVAAGQRISPAVEQRLRLAAGFFVEVQVSGEPWDYGDSDSAFAIPLFAEAGQTVQKWHRWLENPPPGSSLEFWLGGTWDGSKTEVADSISAVGGWKHFPESGQAVRRQGEWTLRWDLSPLGYLSTAAHGHLDALHLSVWHRGVALIVDPGTGAYYADKELRVWLASRPAHNGPSPVSAEDWPRRLGPFLWAEAHGALDYNEAGPDDLRANLPLANCPVHRTIRVPGRGRSIEVEDGLAAGAAGDFTVRWQFAPGSTLKRRGERDFILRRQGVEIGIQVSGDWAEVNLVESAEERDRIEPQHPLAGVVSPAFRKTVWAPYLRLVARPEGPCVFRTTFLASPGA